MNERYDPAYPVGNARPAPATPFFYGLKDYPKDPPGFFASLLERYGDVVRWRALLSVHVLNHPDDVKRVLSQPYTQFSKQTVDYRILAGSMGKGLVTNDGEAWARQRRLMQPMFHNRAINPFDEPINRLTGALAERWVRKAAGETIWLDRDMGRLTFEIVGATLFGADIEAHAQEVAEILEVINIHTHELRALFTLWPWLPTPYNRRARAAVGRLDRIVYGLIDARRASGAKREDILDRLLSARDEDNGTGMDERQIRDEVVTLLLAGHETSANALVWTFYLLTRYPAVEAQLLRELHEVLGGRPALSGDLARLPYLKQVVQESMRLYPPVWALARRSHRDEVFQGYKVPAGAYIVILPYTLHRHPDFWPDPERFDPERFNPNRPDSRHSYCYIPFAAGPRTCIGAGMSMLEVQLVLAQLLQRFRLQVVPGHPIETVAKVTLKPRHGMPVTLVPR